MAVKTSRYRYRATRVTTASLMDALDLAAIDTALESMASDGWRAISMFPEPRPGQVPSLTILWERPGNNDEGTTELREIREAQR